MEIAWWAEGKDTMGRKNITIILSNGGFNMRTLEDDINRGAAIKIGYFYYEKYGKEAVKIIQNLKIHMISVNINTKELTIKLERPGVLIGVKGENINNLKLFMGIDKINIIEENVLDGLYSFVYSYPIDDCNDWEDY
jgi:hypothetical protein